MNKTIFITCILLFAFSCTFSQSNWKKYKFKKAHFSINFPTKPKQNVKKGKKKTLYKIKAKDGIYHYSVTASDLRKRIDQISSLKKTSVDTFVKGVKGTIDEQKTFKIGKHEGIELKVSTPKGGKINYRVICIGNFHYQIIVVTAQEYANAEDVATFFNSFKYRE